VSELLASFAAAGGAPPASHEVVRVHRDGTVRALAGTAWPGLGPASEAGAYAFALDPAALRELERLASELPPAPAAPLEPGSGRYVIEAGGERVQWDPFADSPGPLADRLRALLGEARAHPLAAVRLEVEGALTYRFTALGSEPVELTVARLSARVVAVPSPPADPPPLAWAREATPVDAAGDARVRLAPGESTAMRAELTLPDAPHHRIDGFARVSLEAAGERVDATLAAGPSVR